MMGDVGLDKLEQSQWGLVTQATSNPIIYHACCISISRFILQKRGPEKYKL